MKTSFKGDEALPGMKTSFKGLDGSFGGDKETRSTLARLRASQKALTDSRKELHQEAEAARSAVSQAQAGQPGGLYLHNRPAVDSAAVRESHSGWGRARSARELPVEVSVHDGSNDVVITQPPVSSSRAGSCLASPSGSVRGRKGSAERSELGQVQGFSQRLVVPESSLSPRSAGGRKTTYI